MAVLASELEFHVGVPEPLGTDLKSAVSAIIEPKSSSVARPC